MILRTLHGGDREYRAAEWGSSHIIPTPWSNGVSYAGELVSLERAAGLPAVLAAIRLVSETIARLPLSVYQGHNADRKPVPNTWQWALLRDDPNPDTTAFDFFQDIAASVEGTGNAYVHKIKAARGRVVALEALDPARVEVRVEDGVKVFVVKGDNGQQSEFDSGRILHVRGFALRGGAMGLSPIALCRERLGTHLAMERFQGSHFANNAQPGVVIQFPQNITTQQGREWIDYWNSEHQGPGNAGKASAVGGGAEVKTLPVNLTDAQFVEVMGYGVEDIARMFRVPAALLDHTEQSETIQNQEATARHFLQFSLAPRLRRIQQAFHSDQDLFPAGSPLYPQFDTDDLISISAATQADVDHKYVQAGIFLRDEVRADRGKPPLPGGAGQVVPATPVGAGPEALPNVAQPEEE